VKELTKIFILRPEIWSKVQVITVTDYRRFLRISVAMLNDDTGNLCSRVLWIHCIRRNEKIDYGTKQYAYSSALSGRINTRPSLIQTSTGYLGIVSNKQQAAPYETKMPPPQAEDEALRTSVARPPTREMNPKEEKKNKSRGGNRERGERDYLRRWSPPAHLLKPRKAEGREGGGCGDREKGGHRTGRRI